MRGVKSEQSRTRVHPQVENRARNPGRWAGSWCTGAAVLKENMAEFLCMQKSQITESEAAKSEGDRCVT